MQIGIALILLSLRISVCHRCYVAARDATKFYRSKKPPNTATAKYKKLEDIASLDADSFIAEVRKRRPKSEGRFTPGALGDLRSGYEELATPAKEARTKSAVLERRLTGLVNRAYDLTEEETSLMWNTAPPRMLRF